MNTSGQDRRHEGYARAQIQIVQTIAARFYRMKLDNGEFDVADTFNDYAFKAMYAAVINPEKAGIKLSKVLLTINPPGDNTVGWPELLELWKALIAAKNIIHDGEMVLEQRSSDPDFPRGWHMHIATKNRSGRARSQFIQTVYYYYKKIIGNHGTSVIHFCKKHEAYEYVNGIKSGDKKLKKLRCDIILREKLSYDKIYKQCLPEPMEKSDVVQVAERRQHVVPSTVPLAINSIKTL